MTIKKCLFCYSEILSKYKKFCSHKCSASFNNKKRTKTTLGKKKNLKCKLCSKEYIGSIHTSGDKQYCDNCKIIKYKKEIKNNCIDCKVNIDHNGKYCDECRRQFISKLRINNIKNGKTNFKSIKCKYLFNEKVIMCDSKLEYACLDYFQKKYKVFDMDRSEDIISYTYEGKKKNYLPDFKIWTDCGTFLVECKSEIGSQSLNEKWNYYNETAPLKKEALHKWCEAEDLKPFWFEKKMHRSFYNNLKL